MKEKEMEELTNKMQEKLGKDAAALIADDIGLLISDAKKVNKQEEKYQADIQRLKEQKEKLIETNGNLLLQVSVAEDNISQGNNKGKEEEPPKPYDFRTAIDEFGNFIH